MRVIRTSERLSYKMCRQRWWWAYVDGLTAKRVSNPLRFGSLAHEALAVYYKPGRRRGPHPAKTFKKVAIEDIKEHGPLSIFNEEEDGAQDGLEIGIDMMEHYVEVYGKDEEIEVISPEQPFQIDVHHPTTGKYLFTYVGTFDAVVRYLRTGKIGMLEHKTGRSAGKQGTPLPLDEQAGSYFAYGTDWLRAMKILKPKESLDFILYNFLRKARRDVRPKNEQGLFLNKDGSVSKRQPPAFFAREYTFRSDADRANLMRRVLNEHREMEMVRNGKLAVIKNPGDHCNWCEFRDMCEVHESGSDWEALRDQLYTTWDPYEDHEGSLT